MPNTIGPHTQNEKRLLSASQVKVFLSSRMKSEKHNGSDPSVCPPVMRNIFGGFDKTLGNDACRDSIYTGLPKGGYYNRALHNTFDPRLHSGILYNCTDICVLARFCQNLRNSYISVIEFRETLSRCCASQSHSQQYFLQHLTLSTVKSVTQQHMLQAGMFSS